MSKSAPLAIAITIALLMCTGCAGGGTGTQNAFVPNASTASTPPGTTSSTTATGTTAAGSSTTSVPTGTSTSTSTPSASGPSSNSSSSGAPTTTVSAPNTPPVMVPATPTPSGSSGSGTTTPPPLIPTTTLAAETANNTSAAPTFTLSSNNNATAGNVSQVNVHNLLYPGSTAKVYAHYLGWWMLTGGSHIHIGYDSATAAQAHAQISDMMNRGIDGLIVDWYGAGNTHIDQATQFIKLDAETRGGTFTFAIMEDQGAVRTCAYTAGCDVTQAVINDLNYINTTYASSPAYMRVNGQPVIFTFDTENLPNIDWATVTANVQGNPKIVLRNDQGFRISFTSGSYSWVPINKANPDDWGQAYLDDFYATSRSYASEQVYAGTWKGFNDTLASWTQDRIVNQNCGQTWMSTFDEMNKYFSTSQQPTAAQLVTWNDYEEGTEIETGIDNCVSVAGSVTGSMLDWSISGGQENTIDHYTIYISLDGQNLMKLADVNAGTHQADLSQYVFAAGNYTLYVKAIGQPSMLNQMSAAIPYTR